MSSPITVAQALAAAKASGLARLDAQVLLAHHLGRSRAWLIAHDSDLVPEPRALAFAADCARRADAVPLAYLVGEREFHGLALQVNAAVLVPRPETEGLVQWGLECVAGLAAPEVLDLGTGSGAIALAMKHRRPDARLVASDASGPALAVARANGRHLGLAVEWRQGPWWQACQAGERFDIVLSNPPYVAAGDPHLAALRHEPLGALTPGGDGLGALRDIVQGAEAHLRPGGWLLLEHGHDQGEAVQAMLRATGFGHVATRPDLAGLPRCTGGCLVGPAR